MALDYEQWKSRVASRSDITGMVTHLTKPSNGIKNLSEFKEEEINLQATQNLIKILKDGEILGSTTQTGFIVGKTPAVCFQEAPLYGVIQNVEHEYKRRTLNPKEKYRYCGVGLAFSKWYAFNNGARPVLYEKTDIAKKILPESEYWRIVNLNISLEKNESKVDWTHEREWRMPNKFVFDKRFAHVILYDKNCWDYFIKNCPEDIFKAIYGITVLKSIMM